MLKRSVFAILFSAALSGAQMPAAATPGGGAKDFPEAPSRYLWATADCYAVGERVARQAGGTLAAAKPATRGGQAVCVVVVLIPNPDGNRPRRQEIVVPQ